MKFLTLLMTLIVFSNLYPLKVDAKEPLLTLQFIDKGGRPLVNMRTKLLHHTETTVITDDQGMIRVPLNEGYPEKLSVTTHFEYSLKDEPAFVVGILDDNGVLMHVKNTFDIVVEGPKDLQQVLKIQSIDQANLRYNDQLITVYQYLSDSVYFYDKVLSVYDDFDIPTFYVACYGSDESTFYFDNITIISEPDMPVNNENAPQNREWHEYNHHILFNLHKKWPQAPEGYEKNHAGFLNVNTSDSYVEGFAEFMSLMVGEYSGYSFGDVYHPIGSMELDYIPVDYTGMGEEFAIVGVLWDLYDEINDDPLQLPLKDIWAVLSQFNNDFTHVYERLATRYPRHKMQINQIFLNHGFFINLDQGNGRWDFGEPYISWPDRYKAGEYFIDLPRLDGKIFYAYTKGEKIGSAGDVTRPFRRTTMAPAGHCIKTENKSVCYTVDVAFDHEDIRDYSMRINNNKGEIKFAVPPERFGATITVQPDQMECEKILTIRSDEFYKSYQKSVKNQYYIKHDFAPIGEELFTEPEAYQYYPDPVNDEAVTDEDGQPVMVFVQKESPDSMTVQGFLDSMAVPLVFVLLIILLMTRIKTDKKSG